MPLHFLLRDLRQLPADGLGIGTAAQVARPWVAEHSLRVTQLASLVAAIEGAEYVEPRCSLCGTTRRKPALATSRTPPGPTSTSADPK
ncbi:MAG: hypothetical protein ACRDST_04495 [Pseudonocardiaceae bacterium]